MRTANCHSPRTRSPGKQDPLRQRPIIIDAALAAIVKAAKTGKIGDGKVFVSKIEDAVRIRTEERGDQAV